MRDQCKSVSPRGFRCGLPEGHIGNHQNGMKPTWGNEKIEMHTINCGCEKCKPGREDDGA